MVDRFHENSLFLDSSVLKNLFIEIKSLDLEPFRFVAASRRAAFHPLQSPLRLVFASLSWRRLQRQFSEWDNVFLSSCRPTTYQLLPWSALHFVCNFTSKVLEHKCEVKFDREGGLKATTNGLQGQVQLHHRISFYCRPFILFLLPERKSLPIYHQLSRLTPLLVMPELEIVLAATSWSCSRCSALRVMVALAVFLPI